MCLAAVVTPAVCKHDVPAWLEHRRGARHDSDLAKRLETGARGETVTTAPASGPTQPCPDHGQRDGLMRVMPFMAAAAAAAAVVVVEATGKLAAINARVLGVRAHGEDTAQATQIRLTPRRPHVTNGTKECVGKRAVIRGQANHEQHTLHASGCTRSATRRHPVRKHSEANGP